MRCKIIKWIPKASRERAGRKLAVILEGIVANNDHASWIRLLRFGGRCLRSPTSSSKDRRTSRATAFNKQLDEELDPPDSSSQAQGQFFPTSRHPQDPTVSLAARVSAKLEEGNFRGAVRLAALKTLLLM